MTLRQLARAAALVLPVAAQAHGPAPTPAHGGQMQEASEHWVELVVQGDRLAVYLSEQDKTPLPTKEWSGKATVLIGGKSEVVSLVPAADNSATGKLSVPAAGKVTAVLQLTIDGKAAQVRFAIGQ